VAVAFALLDIFTMIGAPAILQSDNGREFSGAAGRKSVQLSDEVSAARCPVSAHLVAKPVAQFANQSPSLQTSRPVCKPVAQFANQSPSLQTSRPACKPVAQFANQSPSLQTSRTRSPILQTSRPVCSPLAQFLAEVITEIKHIWPECHMVHGRPRHSQSRGGIERLNPTCE
jgi:hypothetical protein